MRKPKKWAVLLFIMTMLTVALLIGTAPAMAFWWRPPPEEEVVNEEPATTEEEAPAEEEVVTEEPVATEEQTTNEEQAASEEAVFTEEAVYNLGIVEALVYDDSINPDVSYGGDELLDGIAVDLYSSMDGVKWTFIDRKVTGPGGYGPFGWVPPELEYPHGWVGWKELPVKWFEMTYYRLQLVEDDTYIPLNGTMRDAGLTAPAPYYDAWFSMSPNDPFYYPAYDIQSTTATISGRLWWDANADQAWQWPEPFFEGWEVVLTNRWGRKVATTKTNRLGYYQFRGLKSGTYKVWAKKRSGFKLVCPYHKFITFEPWGCEEGHYKIYAKSGKYYQNNDFGFLDMANPLAPTLYLLWLFGNIQYQFQ